MKPVFYSIAVLLFATLSCKKDKTKPVNTFVGQWDMVRVTGGIAGIDMTPAQFGHTKSYTFYVDSTCAIVEDGNVSTTVYGTNAATTANNTSVKYLKFKNTGMVYEYTFAHDTLKLYPAGLMDGFNEWYVKKE